ncbi:MAG TPA: aminotransferase class V-fold PLP-dependent enzyme [Nocardioides sp.]|nr:aminotransferase class V-fold PLP-dependent enzyme [Nocardioides sp.]
MSDRPDPDVLGLLAELRADDLPVHTGRTLAYVFASGMDEVDRVAREAVAAFAGTNGLDPTAFPSLLAMENDLVGFAADLLDAPDGVVGTVTSGGTESVLLAVKAARDARPEVARPAMVLPDTAHAAFHKAAGYFGVEARTVPTGPDFRADVAAMAAAAADGEVVLLVASAPSYAHGVVDPVGEIAAVAAERGARCHVDACIGGWVLPFAAAAGRDVPAWTFAVDGVTSISVDLHKYAYAPKGTSLLLHRTAELRRPQLFAWADWPGYTMLNPTMQSTRSGGPLAGAWAVVRSLGVEGYRRLAEEALAATGAIVRGVDGIPGISVVVPPDSTLVALATDDSCDPFTVVDEMTERGWHLQPQLSHHGRPPTIHASVSAALLPQADDFLSALGESVAAAVSAGPVRVDPEIAAYVAALDPASLTDADFDGLLAAAGLGGGEGDLALPARRAGINALLDLASPELREAVLLAFLDRLTRPTRGLRGR